MKPQLVHTKTTPTWYLFRTNPHQITRLLFIVFDFSFVGSPLKMWDNKLPGLLNKQSFSYIIYFPLVLFSFGE